MVKNEAILLIDDEDGIINLLEITLRKERFTNIHSCTTGQEALAQLKQNKYDVILLDVMLPDINGFQLLSLIRSLTSTPVIFVTSYSSDFDKLTGLGIGGDDYITKPFNPLEVVARIQAIIRRQNMYETASIVKSETREYHYGNVILKPSDALLIVSGNCYTCTAKELELLIFFFRNPNRIVTATQIYESVWREIPGYGEEKTVAMHISKIRRKIEANPKSPEILINLKGIGYKFIPPN